jgi:hypothetical protein
MITSILKKLGLVVLAALLVAQFFRPDKNAGERSSVDAFLEETQPPEEVSSILKSSCFDCHSDFTRYPWYNSITPVNYWLNDHIQHGKSDFNVSKWSEYSQKKKNHKLEELAEEVEEGHMPLPSYTWTHRDAVLTKDQIDAVVAWVEKTRMKYVLIKEAE